jgi:signal transduction histidine kinase
VTVVPGGASWRWSVAFRQLADRAAHEIKNPLNGAVVNVEVVRQRARRPGVEAPALAPFAEAAATELARAVEVVEALLALARPAPAAVDLGGALRQLAVVYHAVAARDGGCVTSEQTGGAAAEADVDGDAARLVLAAVLDEVARDAAAVHCTVGRRADAVVVRVSGGANRALPGTLPALAAEAGVALEHDGESIELRFPALARASSTSFGQP